jgi:hypothetical protein
LIQQKVKVARLRTEDGRWNFEQAQAARGVELWINCNTFHMRQAKSKETGEVFSTLMVGIVPNNDAPGVMYLPAEILDYTNDFQVK